MALTPEDGTARADADSYCSVAFADAYHANRGTTLWATMSTTEKEWSLRRATDYIEQVYRDRWAGYRVGIVQALCWPRYEVPIKDAPGTYYNVPSYYDYQSVPALVQSACANIAFKAAQGDLSPDIARLKKSTKVGPIEVTYVDGATPYTRFRSIDNMLSAFFNGNSSGLNIKVVRA